MTVYKRIILMKMKVQEDVDVEEKGADAEEQEKLQTQNLRNKKSMKTVLNPLQSLPWKL